MSKFYSGETFCILNFALNYFIMMSNARTLCSVLDLEEATSHNQKMKQVIQQKEEKIRAMEQK
jgi:hypothetical protein